jgi:hypothetical protein
MEVIRMVLTMPVERCNDIECLEKTNMIEQC